MLESLLTLSYSSKINAVLNPQRVFSALEKNGSDMSSEGFVAYPVRCTFFKNCNLLSRTWEPAADYNSCLEHIKF